ncbi:MAG TPA: hypothetical protein DDW89_01940 [Gammaproteobacteria bacterium]|nr:hypothetical protein [Gammaproteobacteria bacterium]
MLDGLIQSIMAGAMGGPLLTATLHKATITTDEYGEDTATYTDHHIKVSPDDWSASVRIARGIPRTDVRIIGLQGTATAAVAIGDEISVRGVRHLVIALKEDVARAAWDIQARPI